MSFNDDPLAAGPIREGEDSMADVLGGFPRHLTTQLIEEGAERESRRQVLGVWVLAVALTLFALAHPAAPSGWAATFARSAGAFGLDDWPGAAGRIQRNLEALLGAHAAEQLRLLLSAVVYGLCVPSAFALTRRSGAPFGQRIAVTFVALLSASAWFAGTDPAGSSVALLFGLELFRVTWNGAPGLRLRALIALPFCAFVVPSIDWVLPAILLASLDGPRGAGGGRRRVVSVGLLGLAVAAVLVFGWWLRLELFGVPLREAVDVSGLLVDGGGAPEGAGFGATVAHLAAGRAAWAARAAGALGVAALGLAALLFLRRGEAEERPPQWLLVWCLGPAVAALSTPPELAGFSALLLVPVALVGLMDLVARQDEPVARGLAVLLPALQVALLFGLVVLARGAAFADADPRLEDWRERAIQELEPTDLVVSGDPVHREVLVRRWDLEVVAGHPRGLTPGVEATARRAWAAGRRVVVDVDSFRPGVGAGLVEALAPLSATGEVVALEVEVEDRSGD